MDIKMQNRIDGYFEKLTEFINKLPLSDKGRNYLWYISFSQFYDELILSENGKNTYGIQTEWQLQRFIEQFKKNFQRLRIKAVEKYTDELNNIEPPEAVAKINKQLYQLRKKELLSEIGADSLNNWERWLQKYLSNEIEHQHIRPVRKPPKHQNKISFVWQGNEEIELPLLHNKLIEYKLIYDKTDFITFSNIFTGKPISNIKPIKWIESNRLLSYFLDSLFIGQEWQSIAGNGKLFINKRDKPLNRNDFAVSKSERDYTIKQGKPKGYEKIEKILKEIKIP
jgi:hypothetical protein